MLLLRTGRVVMSSRRLRWFDAFVNMLYRMNTYGKPAALVLSQVIQGCRSGDSSRHDGGVVGDTQSEIFTSWPLSRTPYSESSSLLHHRSIFFDASPLPSLSLYSY